ncbi:MAG TPA: thiamine phosphate synthase [Thermoanaerobaculia bacterium]
MTRVPRLLAISDPGERGGRSRYDALPAWLAALAAAGVDGVQVREKHLGDRELYALARDARAAWQGWLVVNARLDVALAAGAAGVHLPADGVPIAPLRRRFGRSPVIGRSTHDPDEVAAARAAGADYVTFGPVFPTPSKARFGPPAGLDGLRRAAAQGLPVVALGGIGPDDLPALAAAGAAGAAGIRAFHDPRQLERWTAARRAAWPEDD